jgi:hypothetical protein
MAGFIKHHVKKIDTARLLVMIILVAIVLLAYEIILGYQGKSISLRWLDYNGIPFILSVLVFLLVRQIQVPENLFWNVFVKMAPYTFGVYLIHDHLLVRDWLWTNIPVRSYTDHWTFPLIILGLCIGIFVICALLDAIRKRIFILFKIEGLIANVDRWLDKNPTKRVKL